MPKAKIYLCCLLLVACCLLKSQTNLVLNPSFETHTACPTNTGDDVYKATGWDTCKASPDYFNTCDTFTSISFQIPQNIFGYQYAASGNAYCGFYCYEPPSGTLYRELIIGTLSTTLTTSQKYFISFKVNRANNNEYSSNKLGAKMSTVKQSNVPINNTAHFYTNTVITDTLNWTRLSGSFVADSAYQYIMLGNFFDDTQTTGVLDNVNGVGAYYYIDDVCLSTDSVYATNYNWTGINQLSDNSHQVIIYPNPVNNIVNINSKIRINKYKLTNAVGETIKEGNLLNNNAINVSDLDNGVYILELGDTYFYKIIINH